MKILIIGSGGRECAMAWKLSLSKDVKDIYVAPGNPGIANFKKCSNIDIKTIDGWLQFAKDNKIDLTIVGPEQPLVEGIVDIFKKNKLAIFGPNKKGANLEGSKIFAKNFMKKYKVATASYATFNDHNKALAYIKKIQYPIVIKANGLAAGKGVEICESYENAKDVIINFMVNGLFASASKSIVIEEFLTGVEASIICVTDGKTMIPLISAKDHKTVFENNKGPNTGGMGAIAPNYHVTQSVMDDFKENIMLPTLNGIKKEKFDFHGFVFFGIMITKNGCKCLEYNVRMGDPECQSILPLMNFDLEKMFIATIKNKLATFKFQWKKSYAINVVLTSHGYPKDYRKGDLISFKGKPLIFTSGVKYVNNQYFTNGGRVLSVVAIDKSLSKAREKVYKDIKNISFDGMHYRKDIGLR